MLANPRPFERARQAFNEGDTALAERLCRELLAIEPASGEANHLLGVIRTGQGRWREARALLEWAVRLHPDRPQWRRNLAAVLLRLKRQPDAVRHLESALQQAPDAPELHAALNHARLAAVPQWHFPMLNDARRNRAYRSALERTVRPDSIVLDIGAGSGLLSLMAARAGAGHVYAVESNPALAEAARQAIEASPFADHITLLPMHSSGLRIGTHLPRPPDIMVTEIFDASLLAEGALKTLRQAHAALLTERTVVIPRAAEVLCTLVESKALGQEAAIDPGLGVSARYMNRFSPLYLERDLGRYAHRALTDEVVLKRFDFADPNGLESGKRSVTLRVREDGRCDAIACRFRLILAEGVEYESGTEANTSHWAHWVRFVQPPLPVRRGETRELYIAYGDSFMALDVTPGNGE